jgi:hypothetical protein
LFGLFRISIGLDGQKLLAAVYTRTVP